MTIENLNISDSASNFQSKSLDYHRVKPYWFHTSGLPESNGMSASLKAFQSQTLVDTMKIREEDLNNWQPFFLTDNCALETFWKTYDQIGHEYPHNFPTQNSLYDVDILNRCREAVFWQEPSTRVRRCSWFYREKLMNRFVPYPEHLADLLEAQYQACCLQNKWPYYFKLIQSNNTENSSSDIFKFTSNNSLLHCYSISSANQVDFNQHIDILNENLTCEDVDIECDFEPVNRQVFVMQRGMHKDWIESLRNQYSIELNVLNQPIEHVVFVVHGIGRRCDLGGNSLVQCVQRMRQLFNQLLESHFPTDRQCSSEVADNPPPPSRRRRKGRVEVLPVIWYDALHNQSDGPDLMLQKCALSSMPGLREFTRDTLMDVLYYSGEHYGPQMRLQVVAEINRLMALFEQRQGRSVEGGNPPVTYSIAGHSLGSIIGFDLMCKNKFEKSSENQSIATNIESTNVEINSTPNPRLSAPIETFFALGSPIALFLIARGDRTVNETFCLQDGDCGFFNIFHPSDPIAYRIEPLLNPAVQAFSPVLIPHHKGRKRLHLELRENISKIGADLKSAFFQSVQSTMKTFNSLASLPILLKSSQADQDPPALIDSQVVQEQPGPVADLSRLPARLNRGHRVDHVLQEAPLESINEYMFALSSHCCYWDSEDCVLLMLQQIYSRRQVDVVWPALGGEKPPTSCPPLDEYQASLMVPTSSMDENIPAIEVILGAS